MSGAGSIRLVGVERRRAGRAVLSGCDLDLPLGGRHVLMGPSGAGKTTALRLLLGLERPDAGRVEVPGGLRMAAAFQDDLLCEGLSASANVRLVMPAHGRGERRERLAEALGALEGLGVPCEPRPVSRLSGGQRRRVALARCVMSGADVLAFDEPLRGLDRRTAALVVSWMLPRLEGRTVVWVTHDPADAAAIGASTVWELCDGRFVRA